MRYNFQPDTFHLTLGTHEPVLRVASGDVISTSSLSADGRDHSNAQVASRGNPLTGPFFVEGAQAGDTLAVDLLVVRPNRASGYSTVSLAPSIVEPEFVPGLPAFKGEGDLRVSWSVDYAKGVATSLYVTGDSTYRLSLAVAPMVGSFGVAPGGSECISATSSGSHGGNMDFRQFTEGTTAYFPVFVEGALFFIGDGHALQGDGELSGSGVEISMQLEFRLRVLKDEGAKWPRGESETHLFALGNARPLELALQYATTEMSRWLQQKYGLPMSMISILLGQAGEIAIANVYNPAFTVVCGIRKQLVEEVLRQQQGAL